MSTVEWINNIRTFWFCTICKTILFTEILLFLAFANLYSVDVRSTHSEIEMVHDVGLWWKDQDVKNIYVFWHSGMSGTTSDFNVGREWDIFYGITKCTPRLGSMCKVIWSFMTRLSSTTYAICLAFPMWVASDPVRFPFRPKRSTDPLL